MKTLITVFTFALLFTANAHAKCERVLHGTTMTIFGKENLYDVECDDEPASAEDRDIVGPDAANERVLQRERDIARDKRDTDSSRLANEAARMEQERRASEAEPFSN